MSVNPYAAMRGYTPIPYKPRGRSRTRRPVGEPKDPTTNKGAPRRQGARVRNRNRSRSRTSTLTTTTQSPRINRIGRPSQNSSVSYTSYGLKNRLTKSIWVKATGHQIREYLLANSIISSQGNQQVLQIALCNLADMQQLALDANALVATNNDVNFLMKSAKLKLSFKNQSNVMARVTIYDIVTINPGYVNTLDSPTETWDKGYLDMGTGSQSLIVGAVPTASPEFRKFFRITNVTKVPMEPGQEHDHIVYKRMNWSVKSTKWDNATASNIKGLTYWCMVVWHGSLAHESSTPSSVTYCPVRLDYSTRRQYNYAFLPNNKPGYVVSDQIPKNIIDLDVMAEDQDRDLDPANA